MANEYATAPQLKSRFSIPDNLDDIEIAQALESASREIDQHCQRVFYLSTGATRTFVPDNLYRLILPAFNDLVSVTTLKTDSSGDGTFETTWAVTDYQLQPVNPAAGPETKPYTKIKAVGSYTFPIPYTPLARDDRVQIVGTFGWPVTPPAAVEEACLMLAAETFKLNDAPFGIAGVGEFGVVRIRDNPKIAKKLRPYERFPVLVT